MPYVTSREMLLKAQAGRYAVGSFNIENMEMAQAVVDAAERTKSPAILATTSSTARYAPPAVFHAVVRALADAASVPIALHLDHGDSPESAEAALACGYSSVMMDGSKLPFDENIAVVRRVVEAAKRCGVPVEAELGKVGGKEDEHEVKDPGYTDPREAVDFVAATAIDSLAVAIGTAHGVYKSEPKLDVERLSEIRKVVSIPLVLHGSSGLSDDAVRECVARGICKVNFATELRQAFTAGMRKALAEKPEGFDPKLFLKPAREAVAALVMERIAVLGSNGKA
jgi:tagatose 1,6-diphosphate aldolase GatY/KbaY